MARTRRDAETVPDDACDHGEPLGYWCPYCEAEWELDEEKESK